AVALVLAACSSPLAVGLPTGTPATSASRAAAPTALATSAPTPASTFVPRLNDEVVQANLVTPWDIAFAPDGRMLVTERRGTVQIFQSGAPGAAKVTTLTVENVRESGEAGLMGIAVDPAFATNGFVYVCATRLDPPSTTPVNQVLRYKLSGTAWSLDGFVIRTGMRSGGNHDGCRIRFDGAGHLLVTMGETGNAPLAQDP